MTKTKGASWFKMFLKNKSSFDRASDSTIAEAIRAAYHYFATGEIPELSEAANILFGLLQDSIDAANADFEETSKKNSENIKKRWSKKIQDDTTGTNGIELLPNTTEDRSKKIEDRRQKKEDSIAATPPRTRFIPPSVEEVREYCQERNNSVDPERFVDYYNSNGWMVGRNKMKDWKAALRTWEKTNDNRKQEVGNGRNQEDQPKPKYRLPGQIVL